MACYQIYINILSLVLISRPINIHYTASHLQRVWLLRAPSYNEYFFLRKEHYWLTLMIKKFGYNEYRL